jgi:hypothetical protein
MKKTSLLFILVFSLLLITPITVFAFQVKADDSIYVGKDDTVEGNLYAAGSNITIDGVVTGDLICAAQTVNVNGRVEGDVICGGQSINLQGGVGGSARVAGNTININGHIARGVQAFGSSIILGNEGTVGWDMLLAGATAEIRGKVGRDLHGAAANAVIAGEIANNVRLRLDNRVKAETRGITVEREKSPLMITDTAKIGGAVTYSACCEANIAEGASIAGEVKLNLKESKEKERELTLAYLWGKLYSIFAALVVGLVLISLWRKEILKLTDAMLKKISTSIGWGIVVMFISPLIAILLLLTIIGIPLALILFALWLIALYLSKILVGILAGQSIMEKIWTKKKDSLIWAMIIGITATWIIYSIPIIGWLFALVAAWWGLGGIWLYCKKA